MKIGLALSGGGFRATLYHLGLVRFLRDAGILPSVTNITSVSGGSIIAAHLCLNWGRYNGSPSEFDAAAAELLAFVRLDVRNRIVRRYPLGFLLRGPRRLAGLSNRKLTRAGFARVSLREISLRRHEPVRAAEYPRLHILATNLSEGRLCSFNRDGLWMICREAGQTFRIDQVPISLATVPMAVAASSAFPGFFPPFELTGADVGAKSGEFGRQAYTDGGIFDNLGVRMFRFLSQVVGRRPTALGRRARQRRGKAVPSAERPARRRADSHRHAHQRHPHGPRLATGERNVQGHAGLCLRADYRLRRSGNGSNGLAPRGPAAIAQHSHRPGSVFATWRSAA